MSETLECPKVFNLNEDAFSEVIPSTLFMMHRYGASMSASLFKFAKGAGEEAPAEIHSHGEEVGLCLKGTARVTGTDGNEYVLHHHSRRMGAQRYVRWRRGMFAFLRWLSATVRSRSGVGNHGARRLRERERQSQVCMNKSNVG